MLSYQHAYHAGCFADVIKHALLTHMLEYMIIKDKPLFYLETHAGRGLYDIHDKHATKTGEAASGIELLWAIRHELPPIFSRYIQIIEHYNQPASLRYYPGSPAFAINVLRSCDRLFFCELHPGEFEHLETLPHQGKRVFCSPRDGIEQLAAQLPPPEHRGFVMIDPSYELKSEYRTIAESIQKAYRHFSNGIFCLWYPLIDKKLHGQLMRGLTAIEATNQLQVEFYLTQKPQPGMHGCGLWIINPPFSLKAELKAACDVFKKIFNPGQSSYLIK